MSSCIKHWRSFAFPLAIVLVFCLNTAGFGAVKEMTQALPDDYLGTQLDWAILLDLPDTSYYLNYPGSKLWPVTKVSVHFRSYRQDARRAPTTDTFYEELWYHKQAVLGMRRFHQFSIPQYSMGAIIVCPADSQSDLSLRAPAITDAILRLLVDIQFRNGVTGLVMVPQNEYENIADALAQYNFFAPDGHSRMRAISVHMRGYPEGKDTLFYLQNQP